MERNKASLYARQRLDEFGLKDWSVRLNPVDLSSKFQYYGLCVYKDKCIILNTFHVDTHPDFEVEDTINHEIAHALVGPSQAHNFIWKEKAKELGASPTECSSIGLNADVIDAIRSGATVEITIEEEVIKRPKYQITRLQDRCPTCNKVAVQLRELLIPVKDDLKPDNKIIFLECGHVITKLIPKATPFHKLLADGDSECNHEWPINKFGKETNVCLKCNGKRPFNFQIEGMRFAENALASASGCVIMDEMGLGKTPQSIGTLYFHMAEYQPILFIVKSKIKFQWLKQLMRWSRDSIVPQIITSSSDFLIPGLKAYIIGFDMLVPKVRKLKSGKTVQQGFDISKFEKVGIKTVVIDECQHISNPDSTRTQQVRRVVKGKKVIGLSGTPWKNRGSEFFSILNMVAPMKFPSFQGYKDRWVRTYWDGKYNKEGGISDPVAFKEYTKDIVIRREKKDVLDEYQPVNRMPLYIQLEQLYQEMYDEGEGDFVDWYNDKIIGGEPLDGMQMLAKMTKMRHAVGLAKIDATIEFVTDFMRERDEGSIAIGVHHKDVAEIMIQKFKDEFKDEFQVLALRAGGDSSPIVDSFNSRRSVLVASTLAGGEGVDGLQHSCSDLILHERQWNPANEEQFEGRIDRMGQKSSTVNATYVMADGTIDTMFDGIVERKRLQFHAVHNKGDAPRWSQTDIMKELAEKIVESYNKKKKTKKSA